MLVSWWDIRLPVDGLWWLAFELSFEFLFRPCWPLGFSDSTGARALDESLGDEGWVITRGSVGWWRHRLCLHDVFSCLSRCWLKGHVVATVIGVKVPLSASLGFFQLVSGCYQGENWNYSESRQPKFEQSIFVRVNWEWICIISCGVVSVSLIERMASTPSGSCLLPESTWSWWKSSMLLTFLRPLLWWRKIVLLRWWSLSGIFIWETVILSFVPLWIVCVSPSLLGLESI